MIILKYLIFYLLFINFTAVAVCVADKIKAKKQKYRIPEKTLFLISFLGGGIGMYFAMRVTHHKTLHKRFMIGIPCIIIFQVVAFACFLHFLY